MTVRPARWYQHVPGASSGHGGADYEQLLSDGRLIMQLHQLETGHHHGTIGDGAQPGRKRCGSVV
jgi:hypothetical protein